MPAEPRYRDVEVVDKSVFRAFDTKSKRVVALKAQDPSLNPREQILREARAYDTLQRHGPAPGLVGCLGVDHEQGALVLEWLEGDTFATIIQRRPYQERLVVAWGISICKTLKFMHKHGVIHRDIAPKNLMLLAGTKTEVRLLDLGLALVASPMGGYEPYVPGRVGTIPYRAPEVSDAFPGDARSDIYAVGRILADLTRPHGESSVTASKTLRRIIAKSASQKPGERFSSAEEMLEDLRRHLMALRVGRTISSKPFQLAAVLLGSLGGLWGLGAFRERSAGEVEAQEERDVLPPLRNTVPKPPAPVVVLDVPSPEDEAPRILEKPPEQEPTLQLEQSKPHRASLSPPGPATPVSSPPPQEREVVPAWKVEDPEGVTPETLEWLREGAIEPKTVLVPPSQIVVEQVLK